jgi:hypothetical protein
MNNEHNKQHLGSNAHSVFNSRSVQLPKKKAEGEEQEMNNFKPFKIKLVPGGRSN